MYEYHGAIHIHSTYSDGTGSVGDIAGAASEVGLDFLMLTDHNTLKPKRDGWQRRVGPVLVIVGYEINDRHDRNHYLTFGIDEELGVMLPARDYVRRVRDLGGIGFIAHPDEERSSMPEHPAYPWNAWESEHFDGIEIWNHMSEWMEGLTEENKFQRFIHPLRSIVGPATKTLARWDALNRTRDVAGIGGVDAHAHKADVMGFFNVEVFPYKVMFKSIRTVVLLDSPLSGDRDDEDIARILDALRKGQSYVVNVYHGHPSGFRCTLDLGAKQWPMGSTLPWKEVQGACLSVTSPREALIRVLRDGELVSEREGQTHAVPVDQPGAWRAEVRVEGNAWIFTNHFRIR